jgi:hypothetical protein
MRITDPSKKNERGVTILIVGITLLAMVAMAALAIDVASLYEARSEAQRAAEAAALAGAKMYVTSSYTSNPNGITFSKLCHTGGPGSTAALNKQAEAAARINLIAGQPAAIKNLQCFNANPLNPQVTVTVQSANTPTFFARIWNPASTIVTATATAEAFNPSGIELPVSLTNVKPWFIPNCDPGGGNGPCNGSSGFFIDPDDGTINSGNVASYIGHVLHLTRQTTIGGAVGGDGDHSGMGSTLTFYGIKYPASPTPTLPSASAPWGSCGDPNIGVGDTYIDNIAGTSSLPMSCGMQIGPTASPNQFFFEGAGPAGGPTVIGTKCLIHASGNGMAQGQDEFSTGMPVAINGGSNNPNPILRVNNISRSDSVVTAPLFDGRQMNNTSGFAPIIGFLQLGVRETNGGGGGGGQLLDAVILNVVGCHPGLTYPPSDSIFAGGSSPIAVRLIQTPTP